ncbi:MAG: 30S ribosomal protein S8 [Candidatus Omnitrophica bacterium]|nr:30S ribosomal protein S8 [Candidatus Omnitrophota bacterium]MBI3010691.1 30S ribosomal protein S8 [Candidatus Omnitrophota bacterium]
MGMMDPIGAALTKLRNASQARHPTVEVRFSRMIERILNVLQKEGFIQTYKPVGETPAQRTLRVYLKYEHKTPVIKQVLQVSKPGLRVYRNVQTLPRVLGGLGIAIISTSKGLMTEQQAYHQRIGGEVICYVW